MDGIDDDGMEPPDRTDIVIVGGGFGAMNAAMALARQLERGLRAEVTLISRNNFFLFTPRGGKGGSVWPSTGSLTFSSLRTSSSSRCNPFRAAGRR